jgi:hypothetical protein
MRATLNLASRPVRNDRLPAVFFVAATLVLLFATVQHARLFLRLLPWRSAPLRAEVVGLQNEMQNLATEASRTRRSPVTPQQKAEWAAIKGLVDRHTFSWSSLFSSLEESMPPDVRIMNVSPQIKEGKYSLDILARVQTMAAGLNFVRALDERPEFQEVQPKRCSEQQGSGFDCDYTVRYLNPRAGTGGGPPPGPVAAAQASANRAEKEGRP